MFVVLDSQNNPHYIPLVDFHTHIGKVKIETTKGASQRINRPQDILDLYQKLQYQLYDRINSQPDKYFITVPSSEDFVKTMFPLVKDYFLKDLSSQQGWVVDHIVTFPFNDIFHLKTTPKFVKSNQYVRQQVQKPEFSCRFIPFCRVDATEGTSSEEVLKSYQLGMKGLKLHPLSQNWIDKIVSEETKDVLITAGKCQLPIIFDVPNKGVAADITEIAQESRKEVNFPIHVVLGHNGFDYTSPEIFDLVSQNQMFTEISGMRGEDVALFFKNIVQVPGWERKILFGSDANYFSVLQAVDFISYLFTNDFLHLIQDKGFTEQQVFEIASNILGLNALHIIPEPTQNLVSIQNKILHIQVPEIKTTIKQFTKNKENKISIRLFKSAQDTTLKNVVTIRRNTEKILVTGLLDQNEDKLILIPTDGNDFSGLDYQSIQQANIPKYAKDSANESDSTPQMYHLTNLEDLFETT